MSTNPTVPPRLHVTNMIAALAPAELVVSVGHQRFQLVETEDKPHITHQTPMIEWAATLTMSPTTAHSLYVILGHALMRYRELYGPITEDNELLQRIADAVRAGSPSPQVN